MLWAACAILFGVGSVVIYRQVQFSPSVSGRRFVDYAVAVAALPLPALTLIMAFRAVRRFLLAVWPKPLGVFAGESELTLSLGPFGTQRFDARRLDIKYPFELSGDTEDGGFEAFLPEEEQRSRFLPRINHPDASEPINRVILRFCAGSEAEIAASLRPVIELWREAR